MRITCRCSAPPASHDTARPSWRCAKHGTTNSTFQNHHARDHRKGAQRDFGINVLQIVGRAPLTQRNFPEPERRFDGTSMAAHIRSRQTLEDSNAAGEPACTMCPPFRPASGPTSTTKSAPIMVSSSCSTTNTVLPRSRVIQCFRSRALSRG